MCIKWSSLRGWLLQITPGHDCKRLCLPSLIVNHPNTLSEEASRKKAAQLTKKLHHFIRVNFFF